MHGLRPVLTTERERRQIDWKHWAFHITLSYLINSTSTCKGDDDRYDNDAENFPDEKTLHYCKTGVKGTFSVIKGL